MPAPLDVDHDQVKMLAVQIGVREAARKMNLPEDTVKKWSCREKWFAQVPQPKRPPSMSRRIVPGVPKASDALCEVLREDGAATKIAGMRFARRTVEAAADKAVKKPLAALEDAKNVKAALQAASISGSWSDRQDGPKLQLNIFAVGGEQAPVIDV